MPLNDLITALSSDPTQLVRAILRIFHFLGLALGLGAASVLDLMILRFFLARVMTQQSFDVFEFCADLVSVGLKLLWLTGLGFLLFYWMTDPIKLTNEKVWAKMVIVAILSINGFYIHRTVIPFVHGQIGARMLDGVPLHEQMLFTTTGVISFASWYGPLVIANLPQLNFQVPMVQILVVYALVLVVLIAIAHVVLIGAASTSRARSLMRVRQHY